MINLESEFSPRVNPADANYPFGSIKDNTSPGANDGTLLAAVWGNDWEGFAQAAMTEAGIAPSGLPDTAQDSQLLDAVKAVTSGALRPSVIEALRRSYAESGLNLRPYPESFESGGTVSSDNDVLLFHSDGRAYSYNGAFPFTVLPDSTPNIDWKDRSGETLLALLADIDSSVMIGGQTAKRMAEAAKGLFGPTQFQQGLANNLLVRDVRPGYPTRVHQEPNGRVTQGTTSKYDWMFDPYQEDSANYRIFNVFNEVGDLPSLRGENGRTVLSVKGAGQQWGVWPSLNIGFQDGAKVPVKLFYFDTSDTAWRTPQRGLWYSGTTYNVGDYVLSQFKLYQASTAGTAGGIPPVHTSGSISDGVVTWLFVRDYLASVSAVEASVLFGKETDMPLFGHPGICAQFHGHSLYKNGFRQKFLKPDGSLLGWVGARSDSNSYQVEMADGSTTQVFEGWRRANNSALALGAQVVSNNSATVDIATKEKITFSNTIATTVTSFSNARANQSFYVEAINSNTTIAHNAAIRLKGGVSINLTLETILHFVRHADGRFIQV